MQERRASTGGGVFSDLDGGVLLPRSRSASFGSQRAACVHASLSLPAISAPSSSGSSSVPSVPIADCMRQTLWHQAAKLKQHSI
uniref:Uncharacterized protein n=1 Tax=Leersia perrieri TaxID=77586 RepID=A0A0D9VJM6_9ORYZ